jgi:DNA polymerase-3 subunit chi
MTEIGFYHLLTMPLERALPKLLERAVADGHRIVVIAGSQERVDHLDALLWTYNDASFLPHGSARDGDAARQPIWLTTADENPNRATALVLLDGATSAHLGDFARCFDIFDGNDTDAVAAARERWKGVKAAGHQITYWQQTEAGWDKHAAATSEQR